MPHKELRFGDEDRQLMIAGVQKLTNAVKVTMGPSGRNFVLEKSFGSPEGTKDGASVAKEVEFEDRFKKMGAQMVREIALQHQMKPLIHPNPIFKGSAPVGNEIEKEVALQQMMSA